MCALFSAASITAQAQTMGDELRELVRSNPRIEEQRAILRRAQESVRSARSGFLPTVTATGSYGTEEVYNLSTRTASTDSDFMPFNSLGIEIRQTLFDGMRTSNSVDSSLMARDSVAFALESTVQNTLLQGTTSYLTVLRLNELIRVARARERTIREQLNLETERVERGAGIEVDVLQAKSRLQLAIEARVDLEGQLRQAIAGYILAFNREPDITSMRLEPMPMEIVPATVDDALYIARSQNPLIVGREFLARSARFSIEAERAGYMPTLSAVGRWNHESNVGGTRAIEEDMALLIQMSWEIFSGFRTQAAIATAQENWLEQLAAGDRTLREVERQVRQAWTKLENTTERKELLFNAVSIAQEVFVARQKLRAAGKETTINVLDAENEVFQAEQNLIRADYDARIAIYELANAMGILTPTTMNLDVKVIDDLDFYLTEDGDVRALPPLEDVESRRAKAEPFGQPKGTDPAEDLESDTAPIAPARNTQEPITQEPTAPASAAPAPQSGNDADGGATGSGEPPSTISPPPVENLEEEVIDPPSTGALPQPVESADAGGQSESFLESLHRLFGDQQASPTTEPPSLAAVQAEPVSPSVPVATSEPVEALVSVTPVEPRSAVASVPAATPESAVVENPVATTISGLTPTTLGVVTSISPVVASKPVEVNSITVLAEPGAGGFEIPGSTLFDSMTSSSN